ncbi:hypothetical protein [Aggregatibacter kilianii]|uniref:hypothetical protein n=1 Tax=Aggregatibacter kilianii TaxID=2025884 RepID=UPI000D655EA2|nr:hypothetical protein [Aggregatibacter kilianii]
MKYVALLCCFWLTACHSLPQVTQLPPQQQAVRVFKVEQLNAQHQLQQASLLTLQTEPQQWRWVQTDPLGAPLARVILTQQGWQNDGFIMPNQQARQLFSALATALNPQQPLFTFSHIQPVEQGKDYFIHNKKVWRITSRPQRIDIDLADDSRWRIEELN